jgi:hypothetical protein
MAGYYKTAGYYKIVGYYKIAIFEETTFDKIVI